MRSRSFGASSHSATPCNFPSTLAGPDVGRILDWTGQLFNPQRGAHISFHVIRYLSEADLLIFFHLVHSSIHQDVIPQCYITSEEDQHDRGQENFS